VRSGAVYLNSSHERWKKLEGIQLTLSRAALKEAEYEILPGAFDKKRGISTKPVRPVQDVSTRWDSTSRMLIRYLRLQESIDEFFAEEGPFWLQLSATNWEQVRYLIELTKPFAAFTQMLGKTHSPTIQYVFQSYNQLLSHIETAKQKLGRKRKNWKLELRSALSKAEEKLKKYYRDTEGALGHLYGHAVLLSPHLKNSFFSTSDWDGTLYETDYWQSLRDLWENRYRHRKTQCSTQPSQTQSSSIDTFGLFLSNHQRTSISYAGRAADEFDAYQDYGSNYGSSTSITSTNIL